MADEFILITGRVSSGKGDAAYWLSRLHDLYERSTGMAVYAGSLNLRIASEVSLLDPRFAASLIRIDAAEYQGDRDILMLPCVLASLDDTPAFIWRTINAEQRPEDRALLEIVAAVNLRQTFGLHDGDTVVVRLPAAST